MVALQELSHGPSLWQGVDQLQGERLQGRQRTGDGIGWVAQPLRGSVSRAARAPLPIAVAGEGRGQILGSQRAAGAHRKLKPAETFKTKVNADGEQLLFVCRGAIQVKDKAGTYSAGEKDTVFITGPAALEVSAASRSHNLMRPSNSLVFAGIVSAPIAKQ